MAPAATDAETSVSPPLCKRCKSAPATLDMRNAEVVCKSCFISYISTKALKRLELMHHQNLDPSRRTRDGAPLRVLIALSCDGPCSASLLHVLDARVRQQRDLRQKIKYELRAAHIESDFSSSFSSPSKQRGGGGGRGDAESDSIILASYRSRFPDVPIDNVKLSSALSLSTVDWSVLPVVPAPPEPPQEAAEEEEEEASKTLSALFNSLPSATSRADMHRLLSRHLLISHALEQECDVLLFGSSTTALAELTLSETAKGRGFSVPWLVHDGAFPLPPRLDGPPPIIPDEENKEKKNDSNNNASQQKQKQQRREEEGTIPIYHPLRELFRKELTTYLDEQSLLADLVPKSSSPSSSSETAPAPAVVSHKDLSIDDVLTRYFVDVERNYPSVVANVVRTTGKLTRPEEEEEEDKKKKKTVVVGTSTSTSSSKEKKRCGLCAVPLDETGDARWRGEIGEDGLVGGGGEAEERRRKLCYGCERSLRT